MSMSSLGNMQDVNRLKVVRQHAWTAQGQLPN